MKKISLTILAATLLTSAIGFAQAPVASSVPVSSAAPVAVVRAPADTATPAKVTKTGMQKTSIKAHKVSHHAAKKAHKKHVHNTKHNAKDVAHKSNAKA